MAKKKEEVFEPVKEETRKPRTTTDEMRDRLEAKIKFHEDAVSSLEEKKKDIEAKITKHLLAKNKYQGRIENLDKPRTRGKSTAKLLQEKANEAGLTIEEVYKRAGITLENN